MKVINYSDLRLNLKRWLDSVTDDMEEVLVTRKNNKNLVVISQEEYNSLTETNYLLSGKNRDIFRRRQRPFWYQESHGRHRCRCYQ